MAQELSKNYEHANVENKWYKHWIDKEMFTSFPNEKKPYTIVMPPPNITGVLHLGHTLNATIQDILIRKARMSGYNACWVPGCDHASIATEAKVVDMLKRDKNINKKDLSRKDFLKYVFEWKEKYGNIIYKQLELLGCSVDWNRKTFTMDKHYEQAVIKTFVELYNKKFIYKGARMINWDVEAKTALSDEEVEFKEVDSQLVYIKYYFQNNDRSKSATEYLVVATQRPETIMGDVAICANPNDEKYASFKGRHVFIPLINKAIPIIFDDYVDKDFGTGLLKITPAHAINDYHIGIKHNLKIIDVLTDEGFISNVSSIYVGVERFMARKQIIEQLKAENFVAKIEAYKTNVGFSQRTNTVVEPRISTQWFVKTATLNKAALHIVETEKKIFIHPEDRFLNTYKHWMENPKDWCISRQLWWGQRIPAFYYKDECVVAENATEALHQLKQKFSDINEADILQDEDCLDTWFSSWLFPIEVFKGITQPNNKEYGYYYPTTTLVTGQDIIFFWVARMIMAGLELKQKKPFDLVYFTGMVRDKQGRKMSKSLGNSPDLIKLIEEYGADAVRFGVMISSPAGNDLLFDESALQQGKRFNNKLWNTLKLIQIFQTKTNNSKSTKNECFANEWFENKLQQSKELIEKYYLQYKLSEILKTIYSLIWDDFCSDYLEWIKPTHDNTFSKETYLKCLNFYKELLHILHPFMPFITEELYLLLHDDEVPEALAIKQFVGIQLYETTIIKEGDLLKNILTNIREYRNKNNLSPKEKLDIEVKNQHTQSFENIIPLLLKQGNLNALQFVERPSSNSTIILYQHYELFIKNQNKEEKIDREYLLNEYEHLQRFLTSIEIKLNNTKFVANAKAEVLDLERKKQADIKTKMENISRLLA